MHWAATVTAVGAGVTAVAVLYAARQAKLARSTWKAQNTKDIWHQWDAVSDVRRLVDTEGGPENLRAHLEVYRRDFDPNYYTLLREPNYFEQLEMLVELKGIDFSDIKKSLASMVVRRWRLWHLAIERIRELEVKEGFNRARGEKAYSGFEALAKRTARELDMPLLEDIPDPATKTAPRDDLSK